MTYEHLSHAVRIPFYPFRVNPDRTITMHLTERGKRVAEALASIENELREAGVV